MWIGPNSGTRVLGLLPSANGVAKVMFSVVSVRHSIYKGDPHVTITHDALDLTVQLPIQSQPSPPPLVTSDGQICSLEDTTPGADI